MVRHYTGFTVIKVGRLKMFCHDNKRVTAFWRGKKCLYVNFRTGTVSF